MSLARGSARNPIRVGVGFGFGIDVGMSFSHIDSDTDGRENLRRFTVVLLLAPRLGSGRTVALARGH
jgi:hypothetical protein